MHLSNDWSNIQCITILMSWPTSIPSSHFLMKRSGILLFQMAYNGNFNITSKPGQVIFGIYRTCVKSLIKRTSSATKRGLIPQILPVHFMCVGAVKARLSVCADASEHWMIKYSISVKSLMSHTKQPFSFENSGCFLISNHASAQSNLCYCDLHTQHMNMIVYMHRVRLNRFRATCPNHCYMIIVLS